MVVQNLTLGDGNRQEVEVPSDGQSSARQDQRHYIRMLVSIEYEQNLSTRVS